jgi:hypothetical protein
MPSDRDDDVRLVSSPDGGRCQLGGDDLYHGLLTNPAAF